MSFYKENILQTKIGPISIVDLMVLDSDKTAWLILELRRPDLIGKELSCLLSRRFLIEQISINKEIVGKCPV